jgi:hypothetical protein
LTAVAARFKALLAKFNAATLENAATLCGVDVGALERPDDPALRLAVKLLSMDIDRLPEVLGYLAKADPALIAGLKEISEIVLANWVEIEAVQGLIEEGLRRCDDKRRALIVNAPDQRFAELYLRRAFPGLVDRWKLVPITGICGEADDLADAASQLKDEIEVALEGAIKPKQDRNAVYKVLRDRYANVKKPVVVTGALPTPLSALLPRIMADFDFTTFLFRSEREPPPPDQLPPENFRLLKPSVSQTQYEQFLALDIDLADQLSRD